MRGSGVTTTSEQTYLASTYLCIMLICRLLFHTSLHIRYFDASWNEAMAKATQSYMPLSVPDGARLNFVRISAVGSSKDSSGKAFSVFYIDVKCSIAQPHSWTVYRRYSQFKRLSDVMRSDGYMMPLLPSKKLIGAFEVDFLRRRRDELEIWLRQIDELYAANPTSKNPQTHELYRRFYIEDANLPPRPLSRLIPESNGTSAFDEKDGGVASSVPDMKNIRAMTPKVGLTDFELIRVIGKGSFGKVTLVRKKSNDKLYAMKVLSKPNIVRRKQVEHTRTERRILGKITHPFIVKLHYAFQTDLKLYFVLDYAAGGELFFHLSRMKKFPESYAIFYAAEIILALEELHRNGVVYRDLKPENILFDGEGHVKLADFGLAKENISDAAEGAHSMCGTPEYLSPEVLNRQGHGNAVDWWNLGMVTYEMLTGLPPWYTQDKELLFERIRKAPLKFPAYVSRKASAFIQKLLNRDPQERLGANGAAEVKAQPFFESINWSALLQREIDPPFNPLEDQDAVDSRNFEPEFTALPVRSIDESGGRTNSRAERFSSSTFEHFTFEEESYLDHANP
jgi:serine/threonine protein kinase